MYCNTLVCIAENDCIAAWGSNCIAEAAKLCAIQTLYCSKFGRECIVREWLGG